MNRLTARRADNGLAYLVGVKPNEQEVNSPHPNTLRCILNCFQRLAEYEDTGLTPEEIQRVKAERDAAVKDMKIMALAMRESEELSEGCCFACICENLPADCILPYGECPGYEKDDCFEWRGYKAGDSE